jgi:hypothetical protein
MTFPCVHSRYGLKSNDGSSALSSMRSHGSFVDRKYARAATTEGSDDLAAPIALNPVSSEVGLEASGKNTSVNLTV